LEAWMIYRHWIWVPMQWTGRSLIALDSYQN
jgi:hypothetical protein